MNEPIKVDHHWRPEDYEIIRRHYATTPLTQIAKMIGPNVTAQQVKYHARKIELPQAPPRRRLADIEREKLETVSYVCTINGKPLTLTENERHALLGRKEGKTYKAIGHELGKTVERIRQMVNKAERKIGYALSQIYDDLPSGEARLEDERYKKVIESLPHWRRIE